MMSKFKSDFSLFPIKRIGKIGCKYRKVTWSCDVDPEVHQLFDNISNKPIYYTRKRNFDKKNQYCKINKNENDIIMEPGAMQTLPKKSCLPKDYVFSLQNNKIVFSCNHDAMFTSHI